MFTQNPVMILVIIQLLLNTIVLDERIYQFERHGQTIFHGTTAKYLLMQLDNPPIRCNLICRQYFKLVRAIPIRQERIHLPEPIPFHFPDRTGIIRFLQPGQTAKQQLQLKKILSRIKTQHLFKTCIVPVLQVECNPLSEIAPTFQP